MGGGGEAKAEEGDRWMNKGVKRKGISNEDIREVVRRDVVEGQFLTNGKLTRDIYDEEAVFQDEIDTYTLDKWITGTSRLFNGRNSRVDLVGEVEANEDYVEFRFDEVLEFNIPILHPSTPLTGRVRLERDKETGLIVKYREYWDEDVGEVLKKAKFRFSL